MTLGTRIRTQRKSIGMSQEKLAERLGVSRQAVAKWEKGETLPDIESCVKLADLFGVPVDALVRNMQPCDNGQKLYGCVKMNEKGQITLPVQVREVFGLKPGNMILVLADTEKGIALVNVGDMQGNMCMMGPGKKEEK